MGQKANCPKCGEELKVSLVCLACGDDPISSAGLGALLKAPSLRSPNETDDEKTKKPRHPEGSRDSRNC